MADSRDTPPPSYFETITTNPSGVMNERTRSLLKEREFVKNSCEGIKSALYATPVTYDKEDRLSHQKVRTRLKAKLAEYERQLARLDNELKS